jgi:hypothetical protein
MDSRAVAIIQTATQLIESGWTQGALARDVLGNSISPNDTKAISWCLTGAIEKAKKLHSQNGMIQIDQGSFLYPAISLAAGGVLNLAEWNDAPLTTKSKVLLALKNARGRLIRLEAEYQKMKSAQAKGVNQLLPLLILKEST